ncbi:hypothetical protein FQA39_LY07011 [Lamprigera yunnana]|nr:hypothetical protein FQA39_LY07011 [Lamprigera yunnana]
MSDSNSSRSEEKWRKHAKSYDPIKIGSIDGTDTIPHDKGIIRALNSEYIPNKHVKGHPECTIFVARLNPKTTKETIKEMFSKYGAIRRFRLVRDIVTGLPKGYAFIEYEREDNAEEAYRKANKLFIDGQAIFVDFECERLLKGWKPRRLGGGFGGQKESGQLRFGGRDRPFRKPISLEAERRSRERSYEPRDRKERSRSYKRRSSDHSDKQSSKRKKYDEKKQHHSNRSNSDAKSKTSRERDS